MPERKENFNIRLTKKERETLHAYAEMRGISMSDVIRLYIASLEAQLKRGKK